MFEIKAGKLPKDPQVPTTLAEIGYKITEGDFVESLKPERGQFRVRISNNERYNDVHCEAVHACIADVVKKRLSDGSTLNGPPICTIHLPTLSTTKPLQTPHVPIYATNTQDLRTRDSIIMIVNHSYVDMGIWAWRTVLRKEEGAIERGSVLAFIKEIYSRACQTGTKAPGIIVLNTSQLLFSNKYESAVTFDKWNNLPRKSGVHPPPGIHPTFNRVTGNELPEDHIGFVFENIVLNLAFVSPAARLYILAVENGANDLLGVLRTLSANTETTLFDRIAALALVSQAPMQLSGPPHDAPGLSKLEALLNQRGRGWVASPDKPIGAPISNPSLTAVYDPTDGDDTTGLGSANGNQDGTHAGQDEDTFFELQAWPTVSGGSGTSGDGVIVEAYKNILEWFEEVYRVDRLRSDRTRFNYGYCNDWFDIPVQVESPAESMAAHEVGVPGDFTAFQERMVKLDLEDPLTLPALTALPASPAPAAHGGESRGSDKVTENASQQGKGSNEEA